MYGTAIIVHRQHVRQGSRDKMAHQDKHIRKAIEYAEDHGWRFVKSGPRAHAYGAIYCGHGHRDCYMFIHSTPRNPENHANKIRRTVAACPNHDRG